MPGLELLIPFLVTVVLLAATPGPGMFYIAAQTIGRGRKAGYFSALGTHTASYIHIGAAAFGLSVILQTVPTAYLALKIVGAAYLFWLGLRFLLSNDDDDAIESYSSQSSHLKALRESFIVELTNPKSAVFFLAFLPQFADPGAELPIWIQILVLGLAANLVFSVAEVLFVVFAGSIATMMRGSQAVRAWMKRFAGSVLVALGVKLLVSER